MYGVKVSLLIYTYRSSPSLKSVPGVVKATSASSSNEKERIKRKRKSRWGKVRTPCSY